MILVKYTGLIAISPGRDFLPNKTIKESINPNEYRMISPGAASAKTSKKHNGKTQGQT